MTFLRRPLAVLALLASLALVPAPAIGQDPAPTADSTPPEQLLPVPAANPLLPPLATDDVSRVADSSDAVEVGVTLSKAAFADATPWVAHDPRYTGATGVVLARDDVFPDSLAAAAVAGTDRPILYTTGGPDAFLDSAVADELWRVLGPGRGCADGGHEVIVVGGAQAVSPAVVEQVEAMGYCTARLAGPSRVDTSVVLATAAIARTGATTLLLARADNWADAATGGAVAARYGLPLAITGADALHPAVADLIGSGGITDVVLLGGEAALSATVATQVEALGVSVQRVAGPGREETAAAIAEELWEDDDVEGAVLLNGRAEDGWVYALAAAPFSARSGRPQLYGHTDGVPTPSADVVAGVPAVTVVGPVASVDDSVITALRTMLAAPDDRVGADLAGLRSGDSLDALNYWRRVSGMPEVDAWDPDLSRGAFEHARYTVKEDDPGHAQDPTSPWSTPAGRGEEPEAAGGEVYNGHDGPDTAHHAVTGWVRTPFHGAGMLDPLASHYGIGSYAEDLGQGTTAATAVRLRYDWQNGGLPDSDGDGVITHFPVDGSVLALSAYWGGEYPEPLDICGYDNPVGQPLWLHLAEPLPVGDVDVVLEVDGQPVEHCAFLHYDDATESRRMYVMARRPLRAGGEYTVTAAIPGGRTFTWSFEVLRSPIDGGLAGTAPNI